MFEPDDFEEEEEYVRPRRRETYVPYDFTNKTYPDPEVALSAISKKLVSTAFVTVLLFVFFILSLYLSLSASGTVPIPQIFSIEENPFIHSAVCLALEVLSFFCASEVTFAGVSRIFKGKPTMDSLVFLVSVSSIAYTASILPGADGGIYPTYTPVAVLICFAALSSKRSRYTTLKRVYKTIEQDSEPAAIKTFGARRSTTAFKTLKNPFPDMAVLSLPDKTEGISLYYAPIALVAVIALSFVASFGRGSASSFIWALCVLSVMCVSPALLISSALPGNLVSRKLYMSGSAIINHKTASTLRKCRAAVITDEDIFPIGSVSVTGLKIGDGFSLEYVYSVTASVLEAVGGGLHAAFDNGARQLYAPRFPISDVRFYETGGLSAKVNGRDVLCGTYSFLKRMGVRVINDINLSNCLFVAIDSSFAGVFSLKYAGQPQVHGAFRLFGRAKTVPLLAVRDCNLTQDFVESKFNLKAYSTDFPSMDERAFLSGEGPSDAPPLALLTRSSMFSFSEVLIASRKLKKTVNFNIVFSLMASVIGIAIMYFLASNGEIVSASPYNILIYSACWLLPVWLASTVFTAY